MRSVKTVLIGVAVIGFASMLTGKESQPTVNYHEYEIRNTFSRKPEVVNWQIFYAYNANDVKGLRVLIVGDSIANGYSANFRKNLEGTVNVSLRLTPSLDSFFLKDRCKTP